MRARVGDVLRNCVVGWMLLTLGILLPMSNLTTIASVVAGTPPNHAHTEVAVPTWESVQTWVYQLENYRNNKLDQIAYNAFDLAVIDLARDGSSDYFTAPEIAKVKASGKIVLAYFSVASIEDYRPEVPLVPPDIILGPVDGWPEEHYVKYWDTRWWPIVQGRIDQALAAGFDGAYLDLIFAYEDIPADAAGTDRQDLARKMVALIVRISQYAKSHAPNFKIMPQNNPELYTWSFWGGPANQDYINAIDGLAMENMYYLDNGAACTAGWCQENRQNASAVLQAGKLVLSIDYTTNTAKILDAYRRSRAAGFVPYVSKVGLPRCYLSGVAPLTICYVPGTTPTPTRVAKSPTPQPTRTR